MTLLKLFSEIICRICSFATGIKTLLFDKNFHILILTKKEPFISKNTNLFTLPKKQNAGMVLNHASIFCQRLFITEEKLL